MSSYSLAAPFTNLSSMTPTAAGRGNAQGEVPWLKWAREGRGPAEAGLPLCAVPGAEGGANRGSQGR